MHSSSSLLLPVSPRAVCRETREEARESPGEKKEAETPAGRSDASSASRSHHSHQYKFSVFVFRAECPGIFIGRRFSVLRGPRVAALAGPPVSVPPLVCWNLRLQDTRRLGSPMDNTPRVPCRDTRARSRGILCYTIYGYRVFDMWK